MFVTVARSLLASSLRSAAPKNASSILKFKLNYISSRTIVTLKDVKYTATATATGAGWNGSVVSDGLRLNLAVPKELGGTGKGENPEQLLAMAYSACFLGSIQAMAGKQGKEEMGKNAVVHTSVNIGESEGMPGFALSVDIKVEGIDEELLKAGHEFCPYSRTLTRGALVNVSTA